MRITVLSGFKDPILFINANEITLQKMNNQLYTALAHVLNRAVRKCNFKHSQHSKSQTVFKSFILLKHKQLHQ
jgi:hypothetical protein